MNRDNRRNDGKKRFARENKPARDASDFIAGYHPTREFLIKNPSRVSKILVSHRSSGLDEIIGIAKANGIPFHFAPPEKLKEITGRGENIVALVSNTPLLGMDELREKAARLGNSGLFVILDEITDTHNLGAIIRSAVCFGANGVIIQKWRAATLTAAVHTSSAGAVSHIDVFSVPNVKHAITALKELSYFAVGSSSEGNTNIESFSFPGKLAVVIGSEESGIRKTVSELCDTIISIPQNKSIASLNASVAAGIILYAAHKRSHKI
ncbi:MAG: 23S rRNA (guanosine(2251)-2'-O)-methyltransferase RlmB [Endomicrobiia bacterium]|nr:23S rRNA (guanosine(2251)-2'-O)-methyltransferase RlmB [Endomicrobiia bacterium]